MTGGPSDYLFSMDWKRHRCKSVLCALVVRTIISAPNKIVTLMTKQKINREKANSQLRLEMRDDWEEEGYDGPDDDRKEQ